jgi:hypothetical protein
MFMFLSLVVAFGGRASTAARLCLRDSAPYRTMFGKRLVDAGVI